MIFRKLGTPLFLLPSPQSLTSTSDSEIKSDCYTNVWLYRLFDDQKIEIAERKRKRNIAIITEAEGIIISTQVVNEVSSNLLKKAAFNIKSGSI